MLKKILISIGLALILSGFAGGITLAAGEDGVVKSPGWRLIRGEIISVDQNQFVVKSRNQEITVNVTENSRFWIPGKGEVDYELIEVGRRIVGFAKNDEQGGWNARIVILLPEEFNLQWIPGVRKIGRVTRVDQPSEIFSIRTRRGREFTFSIDENTRFVGQLSDLGDIQVGMLSLVIGRRLESGGLLARFVVAREVPEYSRHLGIVSSITNSKNTFELHARNGEQLVFKVNDKTRFYGFEVDVHSLDDLQVGMAVRILAKIQDDGGLMAITVFATEKSSLK